MTLLVVTHDVATLNAWLNHPEIRPYIGAPELGYLDASEIEQKHLTLEGSEGAFWFLERGPGIWEAHTLYPPGSATTYEAALEAIEYIQRVEGFERLFSMGPRDHPRALRFLEKLGFEYSFTDETVPIDYYELNLCQQPSRLSR